MADQPIKLTPLGNLDKDTEYKFIKEGNYVDALDVIKQDDEGQVSGTIQPTKRNKHAFSLGSVSAVPTKKYRVTAPISDGQYALSITSTNSGTSMINYDGGISYPDVDVYSVQFSSLSNFQNQGWNQTTNSSLFNVSYPVIDGITYIEFELIAYEYFNYQIESVGPNPLLVVCTQEIVFSDLAGDLEDIGSYDLIGDLFIFSTTQDEDPTLTDLEVLGVGPIAIISGQPHYTGPLTTISFTTPHNLQVGQSISIAGSNQQFLNGSFAVNSVISATDISIVTDTAWGSNFPISSGALGEEEFTIHADGIGEIGVAQKDNLTDTWSYTRLLRSVELNFSTKHPMDSFAYKESTKKAIYYTDNYNTPSAFYYKGSYMTDGGLEFINSANVYSYDLIQTETSLQVQVKPASIKLIDQNDSGGDNIPGTKYYTVRQKTVDGDEAPMSTPFGPVVVYDLNPFDLTTNNGFSIAATQNDTDTVETTVTVEISNLEFGAFPLAELIAIETIGGVVVANIIHEFTVPHDGVYVYTHTGFENKTPININEVLVAGLRSGLTILKAKTINSVDSRAVLSNITTVSDLDLSDWSKTFTHDLYKDKIKESTLTKKGEYQDAEIVFDNLGLMMNETYRFSTRVYLKGIGWTPYYWVDDIKVDNQSSNSANPFNENRRLSTFSNYELTDNQSTSFPGYFGTPNSGTDRNFQTGYNNLLPIYDGDLINHYRVGVDVGVNGYWNSYMQHQNGYPPAPGFEVIGQSLGGWEDFFRSTGSFRYGQITNYYVPKIKFNINWDFVIPNGSRKNLINEVTAIEFAIGDLPNSILASGLGVVSAKINKSSNSTIKCQATPNLFYPNSDIFEYDYHPFAFRASYQDPIASTDGYIPFYKYRHYNAIPKYPWGGYYRQTQTSNSSHELIYSAVQQSPVRNVFSFYSPDTAVLQSEGGASAGNQLIAGATDVLLHGSYGTVKALPGNPRKSATNQHDLEDNWFSGFTGPPPFIPSLNNSLSLISENPDWAYGIFSLLHPYGPEYNSITNLKIEDSAFIPDSGLGVSTVGGFAYNIWDSTKILVEDAQSGTGQPGSVYVGSPMLGTLDLISQRPDRAVFKLDGNLSYDLDAYHDRQDARKMDRGMHYVQLFKDKTASYPTIATTNYTKIGGTKYFEDRPEETIQVDGGDTSTSLFFYKNRNACTLIKDSISQRYLSGSGIAYVAQSRQNIKGLKGFSELVEVTDDDTGDTYETVNPKVLYPYNFYGPNGLTNRYTTTGFGAAIDGITGSPSGGVDVETSGIAIWLLCRGTANKYVDQTIVDSDYNFLDVISSSQATTFFPQELDPELNSKPTRIVWSNKKFPGELLDSYRNILPASYKDLDFSFGEINDHKNVNGELFTLQDRKFQLQHFNSRGTLQTTDADIDIVIGEADVLSRDGKTLSSYGTQHKFSVIKGASPGGKDVIYWFNIENGLFMRFGADGTVVLSDRSRVRSFASNNTRWVQRQYMPTKNYGIRGVWDDRFKEAIWTFIGIRESRGLWKQATNSTDTYNVGDSVTNNTYTNYPFEQIPDVYVCIQSHNPSSDTEPGSGTSISGRYWRLVEKDDPEYYSVFTIAFNELTNGFSTFYSHIPKTYLKWSNKFLSSNPLHRSEIYEHRYGYDKWYEYAGAWKESEPFIEGVVNYIPEQSKKFVAMQSLSDNAPDKIELITKDHESFLVSSDFDPEDDAWRSPIKNDILTSSTSDPNDDTVALFGSYMRVKFKFFNGAYNKLNNLIIKIRARLRRTGS